MRVKLASGGSGTIRNIRYGVAMDLEDGSPDLGWAPQNFLDTDASDFVEALAPRHEAPARNPLDPDAPSEAMIDAGLKVDWSNEDERGTVINVWYAMNAARRREAPAEGMRAALVEIASRPLLDEPVSADGHRNRCPSCGHAWNCLLYTSDAADE